MCVVRNGRAEEDSVCRAGLSGHHQRGGQISRRGHRQQVSMWLMLSLPADRASGMGLFVIIETFQ